MLIIYTLQMSADPNDRRSTVVRRFEVIAESCTDARSHLAVVLDDNKWLDKDVSTCREGKSLQFPYLICTQGY
jgi:peptide methionine sulfoxide reductase MsrB